MAQVKIKSSVFGAIVAGLYTDPNSTSRDGGIHRVQGTVSNAADDSAGSRYLLVQIPTSAILLPETKFDTESWGFAACQLGIDEDPDALYTGAPGASDVAPIAQWGAKWNVPVWQQLGLTSDPLKTIDLVSIAAANATGAGSLKFDIVYANYL